jgi:hypothetical protein
MFIRKIALASFLIAGFITSGAMAQTTTATAIRTISFPLIGLGSSQTAQITVANLAAASSSGTAASCTGSISFLNAAGTTIGTATSFTLASGVISSATLPFAKVGATGSHVVVRAVITETPASGVPCQLDSLLEVYDTASGVDARTTDGGTISTGGLGHS